jgi:N-acetylmuramoyl-L-alanine amidase
LVFKVQISASPNKLELTPDNFKGLKNVTCTQSSLYIYMYGSTTNYDEAKKLLKEAIAKGYDSAFIVALRDGKRVNLKVVIKK